MGHDVVLTLLETLTVLQKRTRKVSVNHHFYFSLKQSFEMGGHVASALAYLTNFGLRVGLPTITVEAGYRLNTVALPL
jgi:hypothetical protein